MLEYGLFGCRTVLIVKDLSMDFEDGDYLHDGDKIFEFKGSFPICLNGNLTSLKTGVMTPIKLNDRVLYACGYVKATPTTYIHKNGLPITLDLSLRYIIGGKTVDYLHELQRECKKNNHSLSIDISALSKCLN